MHHIIEYNTMRKLRWFYLFIIIIYVKEVSYANKGWIDVIKKYCKTVIL